MSKMFFIKISLKRTVFCISVSVSTMKIQSSILKMGKLNQIHHDVYVIKVCNIMLTKCIINIIINLKMMAMKLQL